jgi:hypothetical protein
MRVIFLIQKKVGLFWTRSFDCRIDRLRATTPAYQVASATRGFHREMFLFYFFLPLHSVIEKSLDKKMCWLGLHVDGSC